jgi:hypothetical protein
VKECKKALHFVTVQYKMLCMGRRKFNPVMQISLHSQIREFADPVAKKIEFAHAAMPI